MNQMFIRLSTRVSYTFAVAVFSVLGGQVSAALGFLFILLITPLPPERLWLQLAAIIFGVLAATLIHYALFGLPRLWGRRWELVGLRCLNDWIHDGNIQPDIPTPELTQVSRALESLRLVNPRLAGVLSSMVVLIALILELTGGTLTSMARFLLGGAIAVALYIVFITSVTELTIRPALSQARRMLALRNAWQGPWHQTALRTKLRLFVGLIAINLIMVFSLFVLRPGVTQLPGMVLLFSGFMLGLDAFMSTLLLSAILRPLQEIEEAATHLITTQSAELFSGSTDREFISFAQHFYAASRQIVEYQAQLRNLTLTLERRVAERTAELEAQKKALSESQQQVETALRETAGLFEAVRNILGATQFEDICSNLLNHLKELVQADRAALYLVDHEREQVAFSMIQGHHHTESEEKLATYAELKRGISGQVFATGHPILSVCADDGIEPEETRDIRKQRNVGSLIVVPLISKRGGALSVTFASQSPNVIGTVTVANWIGQRVFTQHDVDLLMSLVAQAATAIDNVRLMEMERQRIETELDMARRLQTSLLPLAAPHLTGLEIVGFSQPARQVGGDFYNYFVFDADHLGLVIGDVSGKGMQAALMMALAVGLLTNKVQRQTEPCDLLKNLNAELHPHTLRSKLNTALSYAILVQREARWELCVANAGMVAPLVQRADGHVEWLDVGGLPLGIMPVATHAEACQTLLPGDALVLSSDGIVEAMNAAGELYGFECLTTRLAAAPIGARALDLQEWILADVRAFVGGAEPSDDLTLVVVLIVPI